MSNTITVTTSYEIVTCSQCGVGFGLPTHYHDKRFEDHKSFHCPNGHSQYFPAETEAERLRHQLKAEQQHVTVLNQRLDATEASLRSTKGVVTKLRKRAITGTCAFCHRHFANVERHVATKHPNEQA